MAAKAHRKAAANLASTKPILELKDCPSFFDHTPCPDGYLEWHDWAKKMMRTHQQIRCTRCNLFAIWIPKRGVQ